MSAFDESSPPPPNHISSIYKIADLNGQTVYIGSTTRCMPDRFQRHFRNIIEHADSRWAKHEVRDVFYFAVIRDDFCGFRILELERVEHERVKLRKKGWRTLNSPTVAKVNMFEQWEIGMQSMELSTI